MVQKISAKTCSDTTAQRFHLKHDQKINKKFWSCQSYLRNRFEALRLTGSQFLLTKPLLESGHVAALVRSHAIGLLPFRLTKEQTTQTMDPSPKTIELLHYPGQWNLELTGSCYSTAWITHTQGTGLWSKVNSLFLFHCLNHTHTTHGIMIISKFSLIPLFESLTHKSRDHDH